MANKAKYKDFFSEAEKVMSKESIEKANNKAQKSILKLKLADLRKQKGINQTDIEGFSQTSISRIESRDDIKISTLVEYVHALGMEVEIKAVKKKKSKNSDNEIVLFRA